MATFSLTSSASATSASAGQLVKSRLAATLSGAASSAGAAWLLMLNTAGDLTTGYPYFDVPAGWPVPQVPGP